MSDNNVVPDIKKTMERIASEICDHYCKWPDMFIGCEDEDSATAELVEKHCESCPLVQFLAG